MGRTFDVLWILLMGLIVFGTGMAIADAFAARKFQTECEALQGVAVYGRGAMFCVDNKVLK